jgi:Uma2 family endonuclease
LYRSNLNLMELNLDLKKRYTFADYLTWVDNKFRELINGMIYEMSPGPATNHQRLSGRIYRIISSFIVKKKGKCEIFFAPFDVRLPANQQDKADDKIHTVVQPDICVICDPEKIDERGCLGSPDLIVEVISPATAQRDLHEKFHLYQENGVREYWIVFPREQILTSYFLTTKGKYNEGRTYSIADKFKVQIFDDLEIELKDIFGE